jgi:hypothetical protein
MAVEMPARVEPTDGAETVEFPWGSAEHAVSALNRVSATLGDQLTIRHEMHSILSDWKGSYRWFEFDPKDGELTGSATALVDQLRQQASAIVTAAEAANQDQRVKNSMADNAILPPLGGRR